MKYRVFYSAQIQIVSSEPPSRVDISFPVFLLISFLDSRKKERKKEIVGEGDDDVPCIIKCCTVDTRPQQEDRFDFCVQRLHQLDLVHSLTAGKH